MRRSCILLVTILASVLSPAFAIQLLSPGHQELSGVLEWAADDSLELVLAKGSRSEQHVKVVCTRAVLDMLAQVGTGRDVTIPGNLAGSYQTGFFFSPDSQGGTGGTADEETIRSLVLDWWSRAPGRSRSDGQPTIRIGERDGSRVHVLLIRNHFLDANRTMGTIALVVDLARSQVTQAAR